MNICIIPCAGNASRLGGLPKFLLPTKKLEDICLLNKYISFMLKICNKIIIPCNPTTLQYVKNNIMENENIEIQCVGNTKTMNETMLLTLKNRVYDLAIMVMPDTIIDDNDSIIRLVNKMKKNDIKMGVCAWKIRQTQKGKIGQCNIYNDFIIEIKDKDINCDFEYGWGVLCWTPQFEMYIHEKDSHLGYSLEKALNEDKHILCEKAHGSYFDCGTIEGYTEYLTHLEYKNPFTIKGLLIVMAVYTHNEKSSSWTEKCVTQCRKLYPFSTIMLVDNKSPINSWYKTAKLENCKVIVNTNNLHKYEVGAYKLALDNYRADEYIFIQGSIWLTKQVDNKKIYNKPFACPFQGIPGWKYIPEHIVNLAKDLYKYVGKTKECVTGVSSNSFYCNNLFVNLLIDNGLFTLICNTKDHSIAFERVLGMFMFEYLGFVNPIDDKTFVNTECEVPTNFYHTMYKVWFNQQ